MKTRVLIIGGGPSALATAWELSNGPRAADVEVTIHTLGWRLGGKAATGRGPSGRIQEHGIHGFAGFYVNAANLLEDAYIKAYGQRADKAARPPVEGVGPRSIQHALIPDDYSIDFLFNEGKVVERPFWFQRNDGNPWDNNELKLSRKQVIESVIALTSITVLRRPIPAHTKRWKVVRAFSQASAWASRTMLARSLAALVGLVHKAEFGAVEKALNRLLKSALKFRLRGRGAPKSHFADIDYLAAFIRGIWQTDLLESDNEELDVDDLDHLDYVTWLRQNGISEATLKAGLPHAPAMVCFQYRDGDTTRPPSMSAAAYINWIVRLALADGASYMFFRNGTGESVVAPIFHALERSEVRFEFFHKLVDIVPSSDGSRVERVVFRRQARLRPDLERYHPMIPLAEIPDDYDVWPSEPLWDLLHPEDVAGIHAAGESPGRPADLESYWSRWPGVDDVVLEWGRDFDQVVLAIPPPAFPSACPSLLASSPVLSRAVHGLDSCATLGVQLWLDRSAHDLGLTRKLDRGQRSIGASFIDPFNVIGDFSDLIGFEGWSTDAPAPRSLFYLCGPIPDRSDPLLHDFSDHRRPVIEWELGLATTAQYLATAALWLPNAAGERYGDNLGLDVGALHVTNANLEGLDRIADQFIKVNIDPSERYVMAMPGQVKNRPKAWEAEAKNLTLAGDWIYTGINVGSFEGAVMSGRLASFALTHQPRLDEIAGYGLLHRKSLLSEGPSEPRIGRPVAQANDIDSI